MRRRAPTATGQGRSGRRSAPGHRAVRRSDRLHRRWPKRLDPEDVRSFQNALFETMAQAIAHYDGFVEKFVGDAVMAVFGAPRAHEDDPLRALEAAQEMLQRVDRLSRQWAARLGRPVTLHIGVHTGAVVAGSLGSGAGGAYAVTGDTVNTAVAPALGRRAGHGAGVGRDACPGAAPLRLRAGRRAGAARQGASRCGSIACVGVRAELASARGLADLGLAAPLVGRDARSSSLLAAFDRMQRGQAQLVSVVGEAGAGKSRLLAELFARLERDGRLRGDRRAPRRLLVARRADLRHLRRAVPRGLPRRRRRTRWRSARRKLQQGLRALGADADEADAVAQVLNYLLGIAGGAAARHRARAAAAPDHAGGARADRAAAGAAAADARRSTTCTGPTRPRSTCCAKSSTSSPTGR